MKVKALRYKKEFNKFQEFVVIEEIGGKPQVFTCDTPKLQPVTATMELMKKVYEGHDLDFDKFELVEFDLIESGVVGADIRNKLTPLLNLIALIGIYLKDEVPDKKIAIENLLRKEMETSKICIKYLVKLL